MNFNQSITAVNKKTRGKSKGFNSSFDVYGYLRAMG